MTAPAGNQNGNGCAVVFLIFLVLAGIGALMPDDDESSGSSGGGGVQSAAASSDDDDSYGAFEICKEFIGDRLTSPSSAEYPNFFEDDGEVTVTRAGGTYTVQSQVDSENGFGASLRSFFTCEVSTTDGVNWRLVDLILL